jgi:hypothetical protein
MLDGPLRCPKYLEEGMGSIMLLISGIIPNAELPLLDGWVKKEGHFLNVQHYKIPTDREPHHD